jgi:hypothetical protein
VEIKTSVAASSFERSVQLASIDVKICRVGDESFRRMVPEEHVGQLQHQMLVLKINHVMYVSASETGIAFIVLAYCNSRVLRICESVLDQTLKDCVECAHEQDPVIPDIQDAELRKAIGNRLKFWMLVSGYVLENGPFYPQVKLFRHGVQSLYSKTRGWVDGSAQAPTILRC